MNIYPFLAAAALAVLVAMWVTIRMKQKRHSVANACLKQFRDRSYADLEDFLDRAMIIQKRSVITPDDAAEVEIIRLDLAKWNVDSLAPAIGSVLWQYRTEKWYTSLFDQMAALMYGWNPEQVSKFIGLTTERYVADSAFVRRVATDFCAALNKYEESVRRERHDRVASAVVNWYA